MIIGSRAVLKIVGRDERLGGSSPSASAKNSTVMVKGYFDLLAHSVERKTANFDVVGSIPT